LNISDTYCGTSGKGGHADPKYPEGRTGQGVSIAQKAHTKAIQKTGEYREKGRSSNNHFSSVYGHLNCLPFSGTLKIARIKG